jgi:hypothetical protein
MGDPDCFIKCFDRYTFLKREHPVVAVLFGPVMRIKNTVVKLYLTIKNYHDNDMKKTVEINPHRLL